MKVRIAIGLTLAQMSQISTRSPGLEGVSPVYELDDEVFLWLA